MTGSPSNLGFATASFSTLESGNVDVNAQGPNGYDGLAPTDPLEDHYILYPGPTGITSVKVGVQSDISGTAYMGRSGSLIFNFGGMQIEDEGVTITP